MIVCKEKSQTRKPGKVEEIIELKELVLQELQKPVRYRVDWWLQKALWLPILKKYSNEYQGETVCRDDLIKCPGFIETRVLDVSPLLSLEGLSKEIRQRLMLLQEARLQLESEEMAWYANEIRRWFV